MFKKIFRASFLLTSLVLLFAVLLSAIVLSIDFDHTEMSALASQADLAASGVNTSGKKYIKNLKGENYRITWINSKGKVLYDNEENPKKMGNHSRREEVAEAMKKGTGTSERYSTTLSTVTMYYAERLNDGGASSAALDIRKVVENAILTSASTVILAHNHPSGIALPSDDDCAATTRAAQALQTIGVALADHIIVADDDFVSMAQSGYLTPWEHL